MMMNPPHPGELLREDVIAELGLTVYDHFLLLAIPHSRTAVSHL